MQNKSGSVLVTDDVKQEGQTKVPRVLAEKLFWHYFFLHLV